MSQPPSSAGGVQAEKLTVEGRDHNIVGRDQVQVKPGAIYAPGAPIISASRRQVPVPARLPPDVTDFTGRDDEIAMLCKQLTDPGGERGTALVISAVAGKAGVGKSTLALHVAHRLAETFPDGQLYINLRGINQRPLGAEVALDELLHALGVTAESVPVGIEAKSGLYRELLAHGRVLVVLDNAHDVAQVRPLLPGSPLCAVLITSRRPLGTLSSTRLLLEVLDPDTAVKLLTRVADRERVADDSEAAAEIARMCGYLPLALRIAGAKLATRPTLSVDTLAAQLRDERTRLSQLDEGDLDVRTSFALTYHELEPEDARAFRLLGSASAPDFDSLAAAGLLNCSVEEAEKRLDRLTQLQLLEPTAASDRYRFHDLLRLFAVEQFRQTELAER
jgi:hypothetical protein